MRLFFSVIAIITVLQGCVDDSPTYIQYRKGDFWIDSFRDNSYPAKAFYKDKIYCSDSGIGPDEPNFFYCLNLKTGTVDWAASVNSEAIHSAIVCDSFIYYCGYLGDIYKFDIEGNQIWYSKLNSSYAGHCLNPVNKNLIVKTVNSGLREFSKESGEINDITGKGLLDVPLPVFKDDTIYQAGLTDTLICKKVSTDDVLWKRKTGEIERIFTDQNQLFYFDDTRRLYCLNAETGSLIWQSDGVFDKQPLNPRLEFEGSKIICYFTSLYNMFLIDRKTGEIEQKASYEKFQQHGYLKPTIKKYKVKNGSENFQVTIANTLFDWDDFKRSFEVSIKKVN